MPPASASETENMNKTGTKARNAIRAPFTGRLHSRSLLAEIKAMPESMQSKTSLPSLPSLTSVPRLIPFPFGITQQRTAPTVTCKQDVTQETFQALSLTMSESARHDGPFKLPCSIRPGPDRSAPRRRGLPVVTRSHRPEFPVRVD